MNNGTLKSLKVQIFMTNVFLYPSFLLANHAIHYLHQSDMRMFPCLILSFSEKAYRGWQVWSLTSSDWTDMTVTVPQAYSIPTCLGCSMMSPSGMQDFCNTMIFHHISTPPLYSCIHVLRTRDFSQKHLCSFFCYNDSFFQLQIAGTLDWKKETGVCFENVKRRNRKRYYYTEFWITCINKWLINYISFSLFVFFFFSQRGFQAIKQTAKDCYIKGTVWMNFFL